MCDCRPLGLGAERQQPRGGYADFKAMTMRRWLSPRALLAVLGYAVVVSAWVALSQDAEDFAGYSVWLLSLPVLSVGAGLAIGKPWALGLALIPALATSPWWETGCGGDDICFATIVWLYLIPLCAAGIGAGVLIRRYATAATHFVREVAAAGWRRASSTREERNSRQS